MLTHTESIDCATLLLTYHAYRGYYGQLQACQPYQPATITYEDTPYRARFQLHKPYQGIPSMHTILSPFFPKHFTSPTSFTFPQYTCPSQSSPVPHLNRLTSFPPFSNT